MCNSLFKGFLKEAQAMSKSQMKQTFALLGKPGQSFPDYYREEVEPCRSSFTA